MKDICFTIDQLLSPEECLHFIHQGEQQGYLEMKGDYPANYRNNDRILVDDPALADKLYQRLRPHLPDRIGDWKLQGLNSRFRGCRYRNGQNFNRHRDGAYSPQPGHRSLLTVMLYLNPAREFEGGQTRFYADRWTAEPDFSVEPAQGTAIIFDHAFWHDGAPVTQGTKYVLRTDVIYQGENSAGHDGYIWDVVEMSNGLLASGSRDKTIRLWNPQLESQAVLEGHQSSVTCLLSHGTHLWSGGRDREIAVWDETGRELHRWRAHQGTILGLLELAPGVVASAGADNTVRIWSHQRQQKVYPLPSWPWAMTRHRDTLWIGCEGGKLVALENGQTRCELTLPASITALHRETIGCADGSIHRPGQSPLRHHRGAVTALVELPDGRLVSGGEDDGVRLWNGCCSLEIARHRDFVRALCLTRRGHLISGSYDGTLQRIRPRAMRLTEGAAKPGGTNSGTAVANW